MGPALAGQACRLERLWAGGARRPGPDRYGRVQPYPGLFLRRDRRHEPEHASQPGHGHRRPAWLRYQFLCAHGRRACFQRPVRWHRYDLGPGLGRGRGGFAPPRTHALFRSVATRAADPCAARTPCSDRFLAGPLGRAKAGGTRRDCRALRGDVVRRRRGSLGHNARRCLPGPPDSP